MKKFARITGTGSYFPARVMKNDEFSSFLETNDEWISTRTGILARHIAVDESNLDMAYGASKEAIHAAGIDPESIDGVIYATITPDTMMPSNACALIGRLGIKNGCFGYDLTAACSGFSYALHMGKMMIESGSVRNLLLVASDKSSAILDWTDRTTSVLFGDGAGAVILSADNAPGIRYSAIGCDPYHSSMLTLGVGVRSNSPVTSSGLAEVGASNSNDHSASTNGGVSVNHSALAMDGQAMYKLAVRKFAEITEEAIHGAGLKLGDVDWFVPHQANIRIISAAAKSINLDMDNAIINLDRRGNLIAASIVTVLDEGIRSGKIKRGDNVVGATLGGGISYGSFLLTY